MPWYRALTRLSNGVDRWGIFPAHRLKPEALRILKGKGFIAPVVAPPLAALVGWADREDLLHAAGVETLTDLLDVENIPGVEAETLKMWITEAKALLSVDNCTSCKRR